MSTVGTAIRDILTSDATLSGIVGSRVFPNTVPAKTSFPFIVYTFINTDITQQKDGVSPLDELALQLDLYAKNYNTNKQAAIRSRELLDRYTDASDGIDKLVFTNELDGVFDEEIGVYWTSQDYRCRIKRTAATPAPLNTPSTTLNLLAGVPYLNQAGIAIYDLLSNDATLTAIVNERIFPTTAPAKTPAPYIVYSIKRTNPSDDKDGKSAIDVATVELQIVSKTYSQAQTMAARCRTILDWYRNYAFSTDLSLDKITFDNQQDSEFDADVSLYSISQDYLVRINRTLAGVVWFSQTFTGSASSSIIVTANGGNLPADDSIEVYLNGQYLDGWTRTGATITLGFTTETSDVIVVRFRTTADGTTADSELFTNVTTNSVTTAGTLPAQDAAIDVYIQGLFTTDWTRTGQVFTFAYTLAGDNVELQYRTLAAGTAYRQTFTGGTSSTLTVTGSLPTSSAAIRVHVNGVLTTEWTRNSATQITLNYQIYDVDVIVVTWYA